VNLQALIFDVDGTLADTEETHRLAYNVAFEHHGLDWHWSKPRYAELLHVTGGKERLAAHIQSLRLDPERKAGLLARVRDIHRTATDYYSAWVAEGRVPLRDGVQRLLDEAAAHNVRVALATATVQRNVEILLRSNLGRDALERFCVIGTGEHVERKKPAPDIYHWVLKEMNASADRCVALEDSAHGLMAAKAAGLFTIVTPSFWTKDENFSNADLVLPSLGSEARPLPPRAASLVGNSVVGLREIDRQLPAPQVPPCQQNIPS
jgi:HAD superfamily hydrolase (TIGR01509 family)